MMKILRRGKAILLISGLILCGRLPCSVLAFAGDNYRIAGMAEVNNTKLYYEMKGEGPTLVFVHGGLVDSRMWDDQFAELSGLFRVIRYDLRGFGKSADAANEFSHVEDLYGLLKFLKVEKTALLGLSLGGMIATDFTLEHPEMVTRLILSGSALRGFDVKPDEQSIAVYKASEEGAEKAIALFMETPLFASGKNNRAFQKRMRRMMLDNYRSWKGAASLKFAKWPAQKTIDRLPEIKTPTLVIVGDRDHKSLLDIADVLHSRITGSKKVVMTGVSHHPNMEKPAEFDKIVLDFMSAK